MGRYLKLVPLNSLQLLKMLFYKILKIASVLFLVVFTCGRLFAEASGQSLKGKTEYEVASPSFLRSKGLFGLTGKPTENNRK